MPPRSTSSPRTKPLTGAITVAILLMSTLVTIPGPANAQAGPCSANEIVAENCLPGNPPSQWDVQGAGSPNIRGFATDISVAQGQTVEFKVDTNASDYRLDIYRLGYYGGDGARLVATVQPLGPLPQGQPSCVFVTGVKLTDCGNWAVSASWNVPPAAVSGIYFAKLVREDASAGASHVFFIVRDDDGGSDLLFQTSDTTWQAYNTYGGFSLYEPSLAKRAKKVSYNRPFITRDTDPASFLFNAEYPMVRWLERNGYDVSYFTGVDGARRGSEILEHDVFLSVGHDEYWSGQQRAAVAQARNQGVDLAFLSGNEVFWKTRWENSVDGSNTPNRSLVSYKETHNNRDTDPSNEWTGTWRDPRFSPLGCPAGPGHCPENELTGTIFTVNGPRNDAISVSAPDGRMRFWRNTDAASGAITLPAGTLGYEWDEVLDNGLLPAGAFQLSSTTVNVGKKHLKDYGSSFDAGTPTHHLSLYRHASGALVFGAGTVQWSWGLDGTHDRGNAPPDDNMQQATVNLFADMGVQPATLQGTLVAAKPSTDTSRPISSITSVSDTSPTTGDTVTIQGTASDPGGRVGGVEISTDGGATWHPTQGRGSWTYKWVPQEPGTVTLRTRAVDDSGNLQSPAATGPSVTVDPRACPCSIWSNTTTPAVASVGATAAHELGLRFTPLVDGRITGVRFYKGNSVSGQYSGTLWTNAGSKLRSTGTVGLSNAGWQVIPFGTPVDVSQGVTYVVSYHTSVGRYAQDEWYFGTSSLTSWPLEAPGDWLAPGNRRNGVFRKGTPGFPKKAFKSSNYWVDVVFETP